MTSTRKLHTETDEKTTPIGADRIAIGDSANSYNAKRTTINSVVEAGIGAVSTTDLSEGTNLYYTDSRAIEANKFDVSNSSSSVVVTSSDHNKAYRLDTSSADKTATFPSASSVGNGFTVGFFNNSGTNNLTVSPDGSDTVIDQASVIFANNEEGGIFQSDGVSNWVLVSHYNGTDFSVDINTLTEENTLDSDDELVFYDNTASTNKKRKAKATDTYPGLVEKTTAVEFLRATDTERYSPPSIAGFDIVGGDDYVLGEADTEQSTENTTMTKFKEISITEGAGEYRISFDRKSNNGSNTASFQIYRNGSAVGTLRTTTSTSYSNVSEDISGWSNGDLIQLYMKIDASPGSEAAFVQNFKVKYNFKPKAISSISGSVDLN